MPTTIEEIQDMNRTISGIGEFVRERTDALTGDFTALREENDRLRADVAGLQEQRRARRRAEVARVDDSERGIRVTVGRFAGCSPLDIGMMRSLAHSHRDDPDAPHARSCGRPARRGHPVHGHRPDARRGRPPLPEHRAQAAQRVRDRTGRRCALPRSGDAVQTGRPAGAGPHARRRHARRDGLDHRGSWATRLVPTLERAELWMDVNLHTLVMGLIPNFSMPSQPFDIPTQLGDVNFFPGVENTGATPTALATSKVSLDAHELVAQVPFSFSLDEDNALPSLLGEIRTSLVRNTAEVIDDIILNADTSATNGINSDGATISVADAGKAHWLIGYDGLVHLPLVDNTAMSNDHAAAVSDGMFNEIRAKMGRYGVRPSELAWIMDVNTFIRAQSVDTFRTMDKLGPNATVLTGMLGAIEGIPVIVSEQMRMADTDGKVSSDGNGSDTGRLLLVNRTQWAQGFRRNLILNASRDPSKRQTVVTVSFRHALTERSGDRSSATHTALQYNITGVA